MKYFTSYFLIVTLCISSLIFPCNLFGFQNETDNFRGINWGTNINDISGMICIKCDDKHMKNYIRKDDKLKIGDAEIKKIVYDFYKDRFLAVFIEFEGSDNFRFLKSTLSQLYGKGDQSNPYIEYFTWAGRDVGIAMEYKDIKNKGHIMYIYLPLHDELTKDQKETVKKGVDDL